MSDTPERHYVRCTVAGNALAESKEKKTPSVKIRLQTIPGANPVLEGVPDSRSLWVDLWLTEAALESTIETLEKVLGWQGKSFAELNAPCFDGVEVVAVCEWEQNGDKWFEKVVFINAPGGGGVKKLDDAQVRTVVSKLDAMLSNVRRNKGVTPTPAKTPARTAASKPATPPAGAAAGTYDGPEPPPSGRNNLPDDGYFA